MANSEIKNHYAYVPLHDKTIRIDLHACKSPGEIHQLLKAKFGFPEYYGENWSALWDCLDGLFEDDGSIEIRILGYNATSEEMQNACRPMLEIFKRAAKTMPNVRFAYL